ncbi:amino acid/amide ABC transporter membrane protein 2, HAAT family [Rhizobiales bacterium GAS188]|nr:amino acid/amide ABC transporter membrane protein 2, HAAT family [Rhizobiales bacterium GAS188]
MTGGRIFVQRWTPVSIAATCSLVALVAILAFGPYYLGAYFTDRFTTLFIYVIMAAMWNALAGYGGLVSVGQQAFFGLGAYALIRLSYWGVDVYPAIILATLLVGAVSLPLSLFALRLRGGQFAIGMWVIAELLHLLVNLDPRVNGETGISLIALNAFQPELRRAYNYWMALAAMTALVGLVFVLLRSRVGASIQAIRDNEEAAASVGVNVLAGKRLIFVLAALGCAAAGAIWLATLISFQPKTYFSVQWTAYMIFMVLVGGLGTFEGPLLGALILFVIETVFGGSGVWYLVGLGASALVFSLFLPRGLWGTLQDHVGFRLMPVGYRLRFPDGPEVSEESKSVRSNSNAASPNAM